MNAIVFRDLILNVALLLALSLLYNFLLRFWQGPIKLRLVLEGLLFGVIAVVGMLSPFHFSEGIIFDGRSVVISMAGYFGGWLGGGIAALIAAAYRLYLGGAGMWPGVGVIFGSFVLGAGYQKLCQAKSFFREPLYLFIFGVIVHIQMLGWMLTLPGDLAMVVIRSVGLPVMLIFPLATLFLGLLLSDQVKHRDAVASLEESEARYRALFNDNYSIMLIIDPDSAQIVDANQSACDFYGWSHAEIIRMKITDINLREPEEVHLLLQDANENLRNEFIFEHRVASGEIHQVEVYSGPIVIDERPLLYSIIHDITSSKEAVLALSESERRFNEMLETVEMIAVILNSEGEISFCNPFLLTLTGWQLEDVIGKSWFEYFIPDEIKENLKESVFLETFRVGAVEAHHINDILTRSGERRTISWNNTVFRSLDGRVIGTISLGEDITERLRIEEGFRQRNRELTTLVNIGQRLLGTLEKQDLLEFIVEETVSSIPDAEGASLWEYDRSDRKMIPRAWFGHADDEISTLRLDPEDSMVGLVYQDRVVQLISNTKEERAFKQLGLEKLDSVQSVIGAPLIARDEVIGCLFVDCFTCTDAFSEDDVRFIEFITYHASLALENANLFHQINEYSDQLEIQIADRTAELREQVHHQELLNQGMINLMADLQKANSRANKNAHQLELANADLEAFAYSVSHDLRAPLRGINGFAHILAERHRQNLDLEGKQYIDYVLQATEQMGLLIDDLLQYSRLGQTAIQPHPVDVGLVIGDVLADLAERIDESEATIVLPDGYPVVEATQTLLKQIFLNLIENALIYHQPGLSPKVEVICRADSDYAMISIRDHGIGISEEHHEAIFNMFQRLHAEEEYPGTGIGLALVKKAVNLLDAEITVDSTPGEGSIFWVKLPIGKRNSVET